MKLVAEVREIKSLYPASFSHRPPLFNLLPQKSCLDVCVCVGVYLMALTRETLKLLMKFTGHDYKRSAIL